MPLKSGTPLSRVTGAEFANGIMDWPHSTVCRGTLGHQRWAAAARRPLFRARLRAQPLLLVLQLGGKVVPEVLRLEYLADLHLGLLERGAFEPVDGLFERL